MSYKAIYSYAWDLADAGIDEAVAEFRDLGLDTITIAGSYHAGKFLRPHGRSGKIYFPEDGTVYFKARCRPLWRHQARRQSSCSSERDVLAELLAQGGMKVNVWLVLLHNTLLGSAHPQASRRQCLWRPLHLQPLPFSARGPRLCAWASRAM